MAQEALVCPAAPRPAPLQVKDTAQTRGFKNGSTQDHQPLPAQRQTKACGVAYALLGNFEILRT
eukprot:352731-Chlamydomonas_euryale.AAC.1